jgi:AAA+ ATPase superfamily predicted ATPase
MMGIEKRMQYQGEEVDEVGVDSLNVSKMKQTYESEEISRPQSQWTIKVGGLQLNNEEPASAWKQANTS